MTTPLDDYRAYWEGIAGEIPGISGVLPVTLDDDMGKRIQRLGKGSVTLFILPPSSAISGGVDFPVTEEECVVFVMERYDPQRRSAWEVLESSQGAILSLACALISDSGHLCRPFRMDPETPLNILPETKFYAGFAGWSLGFKLRRP